MLKLAFPPPKIEKLVGFYTTEKKKKIPIFFGGV
jgi:hypothetical protein